MPSASGALSGAAGGALTGLKYGGPWGALIGGAAGGLAGLFGGGKSRLQKGLENKILPVTDNLLTWSGQANDARRVLQPLGTKDLYKASGFYEGLLDPNDPEALSKLLGPQRAGINENYENILNTTAKGIGPGLSRGGGRAGAMMNFQWQKNRDLLELVPQARQMAAQGLTQVGGAANQAALGFGDLALRNSQGILSAAIPGQAQLAEQAVGKQASYGDLGNQLGQLLGPYLKDMLGGKGKGNLAGGKALYE